MGFTLTQAKIPILGKISTFKVNISYNKGFRKDLESLRW